MIKSKLVTTCDIHRKPFRMFYNENDEDYKKKVIENVGELYHNKYIQDDYYTPVSQILHPINKHMNGASEDKFFTGITQDVTDDFLKKNQFFSLVSSSSTTSLKNVDCLELSMLKQKRRNYEATHSETFSKVMKNSGNFGKYEDNVDINTSMDAPVISLLHKSDLLSEKLRWRQILQCYYVFDNWNKGYIDIDEACETLYQIKQEDESLAEFLLKILEDLTPFISFRGVIEKCVFLRNIKNWVDKDYSGVGIYSSLRTTANPVNHAYQSCFPKCFSLLNRKFYSGTYAQKGVLIKMLDNKEKERKFLLNKKKSQEETDLNMHIFQTKMRKEKRKHQIEKEKFNKEISNCTFAPKIRQLPSYLRKLIDDEKNTQEGNEVEEQGNEINHIKHLNLLNDNYSLVKHDIIQPEDLFSHLKSTNKFLKENKEEGGLWVSHYGDPPPKQLDWENRLRNNDKTDLSIFEHVFNENKEKKETEELHKLRKALIYHPTYLNKMKNKENIDMECPYSVNNSSVNIDILNEKKRHSNYFKEKKRKPQNFCAYKSALPLSAHSFERSSLYPCYHKSSIMKMNNSKNSFGCVSFSPLLLNKEKITSDYDTTCYKDNDDKDLLLLKPTHHQYCYNTYPVKSLYGDFITGHKYKNRGDSEWVHFLRGGYVKDGFS